jgi:hypothetical protein
VSRRHRRRRTLAAIAATAAIGATGAVPVVAPGAALGQTAIDDGAGAASGPQPLWVPDPEQAAAARETQPPAEDVQATAPVTSVDTATAEDPSRIAIAHWMASTARDAGLPGELPVMAGLVESGLRNLPYGDADSVGFFQMRLSVWNGGAYAGYLTNPDLQLQWFTDHALAVRAAQIAAGDATFGDDPATWGDWIADVEQPYSGYRGRYQTRLDEARTLLALPAPSIAPFQMALTVGGPAAPATDPGADPVAQQVLDDSAITLDPRAAADLTAGRVDPRVSADLIAVAAQSPIAISVIETGHSYYTVTGSVSNHSSGRAADISMVGGEPVSPTNAAAHRLALALGRLPESIRPTEIGSPWAIADPAYFTDADHQNHIHVGFDDPAGADATAAAATAVAASTAPAAGAGAGTTGAPATLTAAPAARDSAAAPAEPAFSARAARSASDDGDPRFEAKP